MDQTSAVHPAPDHAVARLQRRALVVEAQSMSRRFYGDVLASAGFVVDCVDCGVAAVVASRERLPDLILIDGELPDVPAREAIAWLRANLALRSTPIIVIAAHVADEAGLFGRGPCTVLHKPLSAAEIHRAVTAVLA